MDEARAQWPGSTGAAAIVPSRAGLAAAIERVRIYERTALSADQLAGLLLAELDGTAAAGREDDPPTCILTGAPGEDPDDCTTHDHEPPESAPMPAPAPQVRYVAHFTPEAWVRGQAIEVDAEGRPQEWDCTREATEPETAAYLLRLLHDRDESLTDGWGVTDNDDRFKNDPGAPEWIREWRGPFTIRIRIAGEGEDVPAPVTGAAPASAPATLRPFTVTDESSGCTYEPWTGPRHEVGYKYTTPAGEIRYVYLLAALSSADGVPCVFAYEDDSGVPGRHEAMCHFDLAESGPKAEGDIYFTTSGSVGADEHFLARKLAAQMNETEPIPGVDY